jgi:hypothetical protein
MRFEPYDHRMGCVAVQQEGHWYVVFPNGKAQQVKNKDEAQSIAAHRNLTVTQEEKEEW